MSVVGYIFNVQPAYRMGGFTPMALITSVSFIILTIGIMFTDTRYAFARLLSSPLSGGRMIRAVIPFLLIFPPIMGYLRLLGERKGLYPSEFGVELNTLLFILVILSFVSIYAALLNKKQLLTIRSNNTLEVNEKKFRTLIYALNEGIVNLDIYGSIRFCNPAFCSITGFDERELTGGNIIDMLVPNTGKEDFIERLKNENKNEESYRIEIVRKAGQLVWLDVKIRQLLDIDNTAQGVLLSINDVTEDVLKIEDLKAFTSSAAHDLNAPMSRIIALTELIDNGNLDEEQKELLGIITDTARNMSTMLRDLLQFSKLGAAQLDKTLIDVDTLVEEICSAYKTNGNCKINVHALPPANGDIGAIKQVYTNLVSNAVKYSSHNAHPIVEIGADTIGKRVFYYFKDNGVGLKEEQLKTLFTPFKRFHQQFEGNGLGLAMVKRIVEKHGGTIYAKPNNDAGLTFYFTLTPELNN
ncbi:MAG: PAS domain-containing sensor histidine kinase [Taibaiella sp.]|nr:PAS domain-containing sensor histidine kinase [Taibaiella sp.]